MQTLHNILTQTIALFSIAAPILFAVVAVLTAALNFIVRLDRRRALPILGDERMKRLHTLLSYLANSDLSTHGGPRHGGMPTEQGRR